MSIDWFTVTAQIINFLILVWLLKKFLYRPVLNAMAKRQDNIAAALRDAEVRENRAEKEKLRLIALQEEIKKTADNEILKARQEAEVIRDHLLTEARDEAEAQRQKWLQEIVREKELFLEQTSRTIGRQFEKLTRNALADLADENLEKQIVTVFLKKLTTEESKLRLKTGSTGQNIIITTAFSLEDGLQNKIRSRCKTLLGREGRLEFSQNPELFAGICLETEDKKISWNLNHYLSDFQEDLKTALGENNF